MLLTKISILHDIVIGNTAVGQCVTKICRQQMAKYHLQKKADLAKYIPESGK